MKIQRKYIPLLFGLGIALGIMLGSLLDFGYKDTALFTSNAKKDKLNKLIDYIDYEYVDVINTDSIVDVTVNGILDNLDPHSTYIPPDEYSAMEENMKGDFVGIGVSFYPYNDSLAVIQAIKGGPSYRAGIKGGDRIVYADGINLSTKEITDDSLSSILKGKARTPIEIKIKRPGVKKLMSFNFERDHVPIFSVVGSYMLTDNLGYIKINRFAESTHEEFRKALLDLKGKGASKIALDLRDNPGGYISSAEGVVNEFLEEDKLILFTKNKTGKISNSYTDDGGVFEDGEVFILINENSASASEIVAGALQDNDKGVIVGRRSFGKGLVQREMDLGDGSAVRLTIARYYTPTGRSIQKPYELGDKDYFEDYLNRYENGELRSVDSIKVADSLKFRTPKGKIVYGGGGIIPDIFVPKNTDYEVEHLNYVLRSGYMRLFIFEQLEKDRTYYNSLSMEQFQEEVIISDQVVEDFISFAQFRQINLKASKYRDLYKKYLKATMARQLFDNNAFEMMVNKEDAVIQKVIELTREKG
ncbi:carboxyl-terminal processing protease [Dokdonia sp. Hel_I_63]|uniref:S41 family peptidase n=1 Tax=unclassified Dokdonia TaxID=2615033 RepID=UPI00020A6659|nr:MULTISPECIES: S41 family peptidase [unclassified Dokdonia]AEE18946.1 carboxyl-terminal protease [Dokdonia sp. 4H-3-7-5]TVZ21827.1 carboxyl-terminal processing protease [Dokdonia sp. Hel_I_63]